MWEVPRHLRRLPSRPSRPGRRSQLVSTARRSPRVRSSRSGSGSLDRRPIDRVIQPGMAEFSIPAPVEPMLAKLTGELPAEGTFLYEPKWDGFRSIVFRRGDEIFIQSRDLRPLDRYFPELQA